MRLPIRALRAGEFDTRLEEGDRRQGLLLYRATCPDCKACEPIRINVRTFEPNRSQRRALRRGRAELTTEIGPLDPTSEKVELYNRHKFGRGLAVGESAIDPDGYRAFLGETCCDSFELRYLLDNRLVGVAITDRSCHALSAVYCYFDPDLPSLSLGTFSVLTQVELARRWALDYVYLGLYIENCQSMAYKGRFLPHERRLDGCWTQIDH